MSYYWWQKSVVTIVSSVLLENISEDAHVDWSQNYYLPLLPMRSAHAYAVESSIKRREFHGLVMTTSYSACARSKLVRFSKTYNAVHTLFVGQPKTFVVGSLLSIIQATTLCILNMHRQHRYTLRGPFRRTKLYYPTVKEHLRSKTCENI